jgi:hypothetical protein
VLACTVAKLKARKSILGAIASLKGTDEGSGEAGDEVVPSPAATISLGQSVHAAGAAGSPGHSNVQTPASTAMPEPKGPAALAEEGVPDNPIPEHADEDFEAIASRAGDAKGFEIVRPLAEGGKHTIFLAKKKATVVWPQSPGCAWVPLKHDKWPVCLVLWHLH